MKKSISILSIMLLSSCVSQSLQTYTGDQKSQDETATLNFLAMNVYKLDDKIYSTKFSPFHPIATFEVLPGEHKIGVSAASTIPSSSLISDIADATLPGSTYIEKSFNVKPGYVYQISLDLYGTTSSIEGVEIKELKKEIKPN